MKKRIVTAGLLCLILAFSAACSSGEEGKTTTGTSTNEERRQGVTGESNLQEEQDADQDETGNGQDQAQAEDTGQDRSQGMENEAGGSRNGSIVVYFSRVGNTDFPEDVDAASSASLQADAGTVKGNAQMIAEWIAEEAGCETREILVKSPYPVNYDETVDQAKDEQNQGIRPELSAETGDMDGYDTVYLVFPNWWGDLPMPVYSFLEACDLGGKSINVFITHEGSGFSRTIDTIKELEPGSEVNEGLAIRGGSVVEEEQSIRQWVADNKKK